MYLVLAFIAVLPNYVFMQAWTTPTDRIMYIENNQTMTSEWKFDAGGQTFNLATWQLVDQNNQPVQTIAFVNKELEIQTYTGVSSTEFGVITISHVDSGIHQKIKANIEFVGGYVLTDLLKLQYVDGPPVIEEKDIQSNYSFKEGSPSAKDIKMEITSKGNPAPQINWVLNGVPVSSLPGFNVTETVVPDGGDFKVKSVLHIAELTGDHNGNLQAVSKYGDGDTKSPETRESTIINIEFAPRNMTFTHNITSNVIVNEGYIHLKCEAKGNPKPTYEIKDGDKLIYSAPSGASAEKVIYMNKYHHTRKLHYICTAMNSLGSVYSSPADIEIVNGTLTGKRYDTEDEEWWVYFGVGCGILLILLIGMFLTMILVRRRMRSMNLKPDVNRIKQRDNGPNHVYDLNERARNGTAQRFDANTEGRPPLNSKTSELQKAPNNAYVNSGFENGLGFYDEVGQGRK